MQDIKELVENILAPRLQGDGGWVEYVSCEDKTLTLIFRGECSKCTILPRCTAWIADQIGERLGEKVTVVPIRKKPFFWDTD